MLTERTPIERFVYQKINTPRFKKVIEPLNMDLEIVQRNLVRAFVDMGVFMVVPGQDGVIESAIMDELRRWSVEQRRRPPPKLARGDA